MKALKKTKKLTIKKTDLGTIVYDKNNKYRIDLFPDTKEGNERLETFLKKTKV